MTVQTDAETHNKATTYIKLVSFPELTTLSGVPLDGLT
jgi:hypothetical protein